MAKNHGPIWKTQWFLLNEICTVILWQDFFGTGQFDKVLLGTRLGTKFQISECFSLTEKKDFFLSVYVDGVELAGKKQNINPTWKILSERTLI